ncbi:GNAT family N-acetyltransferase [Psychrobacillus antarcticus]|uniref:GNAT family N-acetyltransferase n=1 Tax=Psychrobacillus antarcticus TaxID=2879115 RepID=UPI00240889A6|nr:GNAT family N-acetyltransferase [Psychrobacillus antarcticus]
MIIRNLKKNELDFLKDMLYESIYMPEDEKNKMELLNSSSIKKYYEEWGRKGDTALLAIDENNLPVGAVWYRLFDESNKGYGFVDVQTPELGIAVTQEARGLGIGTLLMKKIIRQASEDGYKSLSLSVDPENMSAVYIYRQLGFIDYGVSETSITMVYRE